jgi:glutamine synthetase
LTDTDNYMKPVAMYRDPFQKNNNKLVLVEVMDNKGKPHPTNTRSTCVEVMKRVQKEHDPWFGIEQEYVLLEGSAHPHKHPLGWPSNGYPLNSHSSFPSFLAIGTNKVYGRDVVEAHTRACLFAGINISGTNAEGMPGQWEYQVGPGDGVSVADDLWMSRYILHRVAEDFGVGVTFDPKPAGDEFMGSGAHCNVSTLKTRTPGLGMNAIEEAIEKLSKKHSEHMKAYDPKQGRDNERRMNGGLLAPKMGEFTWGIANRVASVRIPRPVADQGHGYIEDRRPASNCDPYSVCERIVRTICLDE